jgi:hypothetical protein
MLTAADHKSPFAWQSTSRIKCCKVFKLNRRRRNAFNKETKCQVWEVARSARVQKNSSGAWSAMKKADLAILAGREGAGTGWLPRLWRPPMKT